MGRIQLLDDEVINKIAAGEVVERPASVVKELVENALDAGARHVEINLESGGLKTISIRDDGAGMDRDDALSALKRHATSKIRAADDLFQIATMGFRGEALASIAAVSRLSLATAMDGTEGVRVASEGGGEPMIWPWSGPRGTLLTVDDLFFNMPVRARFLKSPASEYGHCLELVQAFALCHPQVSFTLVHNGKEQLRVLPVDRGASRWDEAALRTRTLAVLGPEVAQSLVFLEKASRYGRVAGLASPPGVEKSTSRYLYTFVNGRYVKDKTLRYGIMRGYHSHILKGRYPVVVSHLELDPTLVDINVHPAKTEVRFQYAQEIQGLIALGIRESLRQGAWAVPSLPGNIDAPEETSSPNAATMAPPTWPLSGRSDSSGSSLTSAGAANFSPRASDGKPLITRTTRSFDRFDPESAERAPLLSKSQSEALPVWDKAGIEALLRGEEDKEPHEASVPSIPWSELTYLGAFARCYLFFETQQKLLVIDQHAFHERVLYERLCLDTSLLAQSQPLLVPEALELRHAEVAALLAVQEKLMTRGFAFRAMDDSTIEVTAIPTLLAGKDLQRLFVDLAGEERHVDGEPGDSNAEMARLILATIACHAAVRAGEELGEGELRHLLAEARTVDFYHNCPHGRRVFRWWDKAQVARWFDR